MLKIRWIEGTEYELSDSDTFPLLDEDSAIYVVKKYLAYHLPNLTILVENRGVYVLDIQDKKMYFSSTSLKPLWRIGESFTKTLIAEIVEMDDDDLQS